MSALQTPYCYVHDSFCHGRLYFRDQIVMAKVSVIMGVDCTSLYVKLELVEGPKQEHPQASSRLLGENSAFFFNKTDNQPGLIQCSL